MPRPETHLVRKKRQTDAESNLGELILILNPNSKGGATGKNWNITYDKIKGFLPKRHRIIFTKKADDGTFITRKLLKQGYKNIVAVGGDGTLNEIANAFFETKRMNRVPIDYKKFKPTARLTSTNPKGIF